MKRSITLCATILLAFQAYAQTPAEAGPGAAAGGPSEQRPPQKLEVNPFTGKQLSVEQIQRELEEAKLRTAVLEEALKQSNLQEELQAIPARKAVELAQAKTAVKREEIAMTELDTTRRVSEVQRQAAERTAIAQAEAAEEAVRAARREAVERAEAAKKDAARKAKDAREASRKAKLAPKAATKTAKDGAEVGAVPAVPKVALTSVMSLGGTHSAVLDVNGEAMVVEDGAVTKFGPLKVLGRESIELNGIQLNVAAAGVSRFTVSDPKLTGPIKAGVGAAALPTVATASQPPTAQAASQGSGGAAPRATLPPLQLPPGMAVLPGSR